MITKSLRSPRIPALLFPIQLKVTYLFFPPTNGHPCFILQPKEIHKDNVHTVRMASLGLFFFFFKIRFRLVILANIPSLVSMYLYMYIWGRLKVILRSRHLCQKHLVMEDRAWKEGQKHGEVCFLPIEIFFL